LSAILDALQDLNSKRRQRKPLLVKLAPDLADDDAIAVARHCAQRGIDGLIVSNTTIRRDGLIGPVPEGPGGVSGKPVRQRSTELLRLLHADVGDKVTFVGVGGIFDGDDVLEKLAAGATLVQAYTGFVYGGPGFVRRCAERVVMKGVPQRTLPSVS
jgi:dihydroorotate dehydrogenase